MKFVKILLKAVLWIVVVVVVALLVSPLWVGPVGRLVANAVVPGKVQADFHLGHLSVNPYTARFELGDMQLANPKGYSEKYAVTVGEIVLDAKTTTLFSDVIHVEEIKVKDVFVSLVSGGQYDVNNFEQIQYNLAGGKEKYEAAKAEEEKAAQEKKPETEAEEKEKKVIIDRLEISGLKIQLGPVPITIPSITLTDIGKESGGSTLEDAWTAILDGIVKAAGALGEQLKAFTGVLGDAAGKAKDAVHAGVKAVGEGAGKAMDAVGGGAKVVGEGASSAVKAVGEGAGSVADAVGEGAGKAVDAVSSGVKAVGEGAGKAVDAVKSLF